MRHPMYEFGTKRGNMSSGCGSNFLFSFNVSYSFPAVIDQLSVYFVLIVELFE